MRASYFFAVTSLLAKFYSGKELATHFSIIDLKFPEIISEGGRETQVLMKHSEVFQLYIELISSMSIPILAPIAEKRDDFEKDAKCYTKEAIDFYSKKIKDLLETNNGKFWEEHWKMIQDDQFIRNELKQISEEKR
jgi:hypothetical protein